MTENKTAIQTLIDGIKEKYESLTQEGKNFADRFILVEAPQLLEIEREQTIKAVTYGTNVEAGNVDRDYSLSAGEQFYNQTYGNTQECPKCKRIGGKHFASCASLWCL